MDGPAHEPHDDHGAMSNGARDETAAPHDHESMRTWNVSYMTMAAEADQPDQGAVRHQEVKADRRHVAHASRISKTLSKHSWGMDSMASLHISGNRNLFRSGVCGDALPWT